MIRATGASGEADTGQPAMTALKVGDFEVPTGPAGEFRIYFSGLPSMARISAAELLDPAKSAEYADRLAGSIVLIGTSAVGLRDFVATPRAAAAPGVEVHAEIIDQILSGEFLTRPDWAPGAEIVVAVVLTLLLLAAVLSVGPVLGAVGALVIIAAAIATSWFAFANGHLVLDPILPSVSVLSVYIVATALLLLLTDRERQYVRRAFRNISRRRWWSGWRRIPAALTLGGETREITILFSDIRGFTSLSEKMDPQEITGLLNRFLTPMTDVLLESGATIDKYIGDAIMCFWNAPLAHAGSSAALLPRRARHAEGAGGAEQDRGQGDQDRRRPQHRRLLRRQSRLGAALQLFGDRGFGERRGARRGPDQAIRPADPDHRKHRAACFGPGAARGRPRARHRPRRADRRLHAARRRDLLRCSGSSRRSSRRTA